MPWLQQQEEAWALHSHPPKHRVQFVALLSGETHEEQHLSGEAAGSQHFSRELLKGRAPPVPSAVSSTFIKTQDHVRTFNPPSCKDFITCFLQIRLSAISFH